MAIHQFQWKFFPGAIENLTDGKIRQGECKSDVANCPESNQVKPKGKLGLTSYKCHIVC